MPLVGYRDSGGHLSVRYVPAFGGGRGKPGRAWRTGRFGRRSGSLRGRSSFEQHPSSQLHVSRARDDGGLRESATCSDGWSISLYRYKQDNTLAVWIDHLNIDRLKKTLNVTKKHDTPT